MNSVSGRIPLTGKIKRVVSRLILVHSFVLDLKTTRVTADSRLLSPSVPLDTATPEVVPSEAVLFPVPSVLLGFVSPLYRYRGVNR